MKKTKKFFPLFLLALTTMPFSTFADIPEDGSFIEWMENKFCSKNDADITVGCEYNPVFRCSSYVNLDEQNKLLLNHANHLLKKACNENNTSLLSNIKHVSVIKGEIRSVMCETGYDHPFTGDDAKFRCVKNPNFSEQDYENCRAKGCKYEKTSVSQVGTSQYSYSSTKYECVCNNNYAPSTTKPVTAKPAPTATKSGGANQKKVATPPKSTQDARAKTNAEYEAEENVLPTEANTNSYAVPPYAEVNPTVANPNYAEPREKIDALKSNVSGIDVAPVTAQDALQKIQNKTNKEHPAQYACTVVEGGIWTNGKCKCPEPTEGWDPINKICSEDAYVPEKLKPETKGIDVAEISAVAELERIKNKPNSELPAQYACQNVEHGVWVVKGTKATCKCPEPTEGWDPINKICSEDAYVPEKLKPETKGIDVAPVTAQDALQKIQNKTNKEHPAQYACTVVEGGIWTNGKCKCPEPTEGWDPINKICSEDAYVPEKLKPEVSGIDVAPVTPKEIKIDTPKIDEAKMRCERIENGRWLKNTCICPDNDHVWNSETKVCEYADYEDEVVSTEVKSGYESQRPYTNGDNINQFIVYNLLSGKGKTENQDDFYSWQSACKTIAKQNHAKTTKYIVVNETNDKTVYKCVAETCTSDKYYPDEDSHRCLEKTKEMKQAEKDAKAAIKAEEKEAKATKKAEEKAAKEEAQAKDKEKCENTIGGEYRLKACWCGTTKVTDHSKTCEQMKKDKADKKDQAKIDKEAKSIIAKANSLSIGDSLTYETELGNDLKIGEALSKWESQCEAKTLALEGEAEYTIETKVSGNKTTMTCTLSKCNAEGYQIATNKKSCTNADSGCAADDKKCNKTATKESECAEKGGKYKAGSCWCDGIIMTKNSQSCNEKHAAKAESKLEKELEKDINTLTKEFLSVVKSITKTCEKSGGSITDGGECVVPETTESKDSKPKGRSAGAKARKR